MRADVQSAGLQPSGARRRRVAIINQHGENRGDEAAMRAMIRGLDAALGGEVEFDVAVQFRDRSLQIPFEQHVRLHHMVMPVHEIARLAAYAVGRAFGFELRGLLAASSRDIVTAIAGADLVVSAPGGPYFGDIYSAHEPLHWLYVWLARLHRRPLFLYAPSVGPFGKALHNTFRRRVFRMFDGICVREARSLAHLQGLLGKDAVIHLTADAAIQDVIAPYERAEYFSGERATLAGKFVVAVTGMQYRYPGDPDPALQRARFTEVFSACLAHLAACRDCHVIFLPQLCGKAHDDTLYHELLGKRLPPGTSWEVVPADFDSDQHRRVFGMADLCLASRYHPQIFATTSGVPGVFMCYEHKQFAYLEAAGMQEFSFDIRMLNPDALRAKLDEVLERRDELAQMLSERAVMLRKASSESTRLAAATREAARIT
jgi:polysaccharide pyruvyl transferase WcaK-like protein